MASVVNDSTAVNLLFLQIQGSDEGTGGIRAGILKRKRELVAPFLRNLNPISLA